MNTNKTTIIIAGATGAIGKALCNQLSQNYRLVAISRFPEKAQKILGKKIFVVSWKDVSTLSNEIENAYAIINLAGHSINCIWNRKNKAKILNSRINTGKRLVELIDRSTYKPKVFVQASAIGYYSSTLNKTYSEEMECKDNSFLNEVCIKWENSTRDLSEKNIRHITIRIGLVLDKNSGILPKLLLPVKLFVGGILGNGKQWFSWIHIYDVVKSISFLINTPDCDGTYNLTSPLPARQKVFLKTLGQILHRPVWLKIPEWTLKLLLGEMAKETVLSSLKVEPKRLLKAGYKFKFTELNKTLQNILLH